MQEKKIKKLLIANRGEIAIRIMRAATELGIRTVGIYAKQDRFCLHRFKADESYEIGASLGPVKAYLSIADILRIARETGCDSVHPGYGFLSESPEFAGACLDEGLIFIGPPPKIMEALGNKVQAREAAVAAGVAVIPATGALSGSDDELIEQARAIGYPLMLKASWGGGGRGMRLIESEDALLSEITSGQREAAAAFGKDEVFLEKFIARAHHVEVQLLGDHHGNVVHLFERDCSVQRRNQKVVERAPAPFLEDEKRNELCEYALKLARHSGYVNAGTAEFLMDADTGAFYFIELNPRIQVEHTVTEQVTGIDIVKAQIRIAEGGRIGVVEETGVPPQERIRLNGHALQCRITTEDPEENFIPDYGRITAYRGATGFGIRLDGGTAYSGAVITRYYDSLLEKVTAWAPTKHEAVARMSRALREFRIRGVATNIVFVENLIDHPDFQSGRVTTRFIDQTPELFHFPKRRDRATRLLNFLANVIVNGNPAVEGRALPVHKAKPVPVGVSGRTPPEGTRTLLDKGGPQAVIDWIKAQKAPLITDTTMRDGHQSLLATRMRTYDMEAIAPAYSEHLSQLFSLECWGGATFDVSMRFLNECPWERLERLRAHVPNILLQMLLRGANGVGYTHYPDNVVRSFVQRSAESGIDVFRVFDSLNWVENMRVAMDAVLETGKILEGAICYTGDILDPARSKYDLDYYLKMARELHSAGCHIIGIKDMAGLLKPQAARMLIRAIKQETGLLVHFHTHDTSGISSASVLAAVESDVDIFDAAMDSFSGTTSQPSLGSLVEALRGTQWETGIDPHMVRRFSDYWESVRHQYRAFESGQLSGASEVYLHEMPGGQSTNLKEQARALGLEGRWHELAAAYAQVNIMFGDIVKVTPSSKVVGDMAISMVAGGLSAEEIMDPNKDIAFPESVISFFRGDLGQPPGGFPRELQAKVLKGQTAHTERPGAHLPPGDLAALKREAEETVGRAISENEFHSYLMYPSVFCDYAAFREQNGPVHELSTPVFFYGMELRDEISVEIEPGKTLAIRFQALGEVDEDGYVKLFFELNGQPRTARVLNHGLEKQALKHPKADAANPDHVASPMPGVVASLNVETGKKVQAGDLLLTLEAMKMETAIHADKQGIVGEVSVKVGMQVDAKDLLLVISAP